MSWATYFGTMVVLWGLIAALGGAVSAYALLAWRSQRSRPLLFLGSGILLLSVVPAVMWLGLYAVTDNIYSTSMYCAGVMVGGFALVLGSVRVRTG